MKSALYLTSNGKNLFFKPLVSLIIGDANQAFFSQVGEYLSRDTVIDIKDKVNRTSNNLTEQFGEAAYVGVIPTVGTEVIDELTCRDPGYPENRLKKFIPPGIENISDIVMEELISKLQLHFNHIAEIIFGYQANISLLNSKMGDVPEDHTKI